VLVRRKRAYPPIGDRALDDARADAQTEVRAPPKNTRSRPGMIEHEPNPCRTDRASHAAMLSSTGAFSPLFQALDGA